MKNKKTLDEIVGFFKQLGLPAKVERIKCDDYDSVTISPDMEYSEYCEHMKNLRRNK